MANLLYPSLQTGLDEDLFGGPEAAFAAAAAVGLNSADDSLPYNTNELNAPEFSTDEFRMFQFKVARCSKRYVHDWRACPFAHPTENARRRDPRLVKYLPVPCPDYKRGICLRGDSCTYSHGVYECWLHPAKYRTQLCKEGPNCRRPVCFFAHSVLDLRQPSHSFEPNPAAGAEDVQASVAAMLAAQQQQQQAVAAAAARVSTDGSSAAAAAASSAATSPAFARLSSEEILNNMQDGRASSDAAASVAAILAGASASGAGVPLAGSPGARASLTRSSSKSAGSGGSAGNSPDRVGSPNTPAQPASLADLPAARSAEASLVSDAAVAMAVLTQQQQAQAAQAAAAQAAAALARLSVDAAVAVGARGASMDASAAVATTQAMLASAGSGGIPPRMSLDSLLATRQQQQGGWVPAAPPSTATTAAAALAAATATSSLPLNEQPFPSGNAPRMSNAVARKLGLAPQRTSLDARLSKLRGGATPPRTSIDGILHALQQTSARSSLDQQQAQAQALLQLSNQQQQMAMAAGLNGMANLNGYGGVNGYAPAPPAPNGYGMPPPQAPDAGMGLHPALLSLVAAQMQQQPPMPAGMRGMAPPGVPPGMHSGLGAQHGGDANMAALMESLNGWQLNGGAPGSAGGASMGHRASMDGMTGMAGAPGMAGGPGSAPAYYDNKGIWAAASQEAINNSAGAES